MISGIIAILGGILAASGLIISKKPNAKELIDKITPYQGWIGIVLFIWGIWDLFAVIGALSYIGSLGVLTWVFWLGISAVEIVVGFLLGFGLISKYALSKSEAAMEKGQKIRTKLTKIQSPLGLILIALGLLYIIVRYVL